MAAIESQTSASSTMGIGALVFPVYGFYGFMSGNKMTLALYTQLLLVDSLHFLLGFY